MNPVCIEPDLFPSPKSIYIRDVTWCEESGERGKTQFLNDLLAQLTKMTAEQTQDEFEPDTGWIWTFGLIYGKTVQFFFLCYTTYKSPNYRLPLWSLVYWTVSLGLFLSGKREGKEQGVILLFICILVPKCKYNFLCYFFVVTTEMNILIR